MAEDSYKEWINSYKENFPYYNPTGNENEIPIVASSVKYNFNENEILPVDSLKGIVECGFNIGMESSFTNETLISNLSAAKSAGVKLIFFNSRFTHDINGVCSFIKDHGDNVDDIGGIRFYDEPKYPVLIGNDEEVKEGIKKEDKLQPKYKTFMEQRPPWNAYINLIGGPENGFMNPAYRIEEKEKDENISSAELNKIKDAAYINYLQTYQDNFKPSFFCYDYYPIYENIQLIYEGIFPVYYNNKEGDITIAPRFYKDLQLFRELSSEYKRPFWTFCKGMIFMSLERIKYSPIALEKNLRYEAFSALAYGAQGLVYWTYACRPTTENECHISALLDRKDKKTASWYFAQKINAEIKKYQHIFMNSKIIEVVETNSYMFKSPFCETNYRLNIESSNDQGFIATVFQAKDSSYAFLVIVSKDVLAYQNLKILNTSTTKNDVIELTPVKSSGPFNSVVPRNETINRVLIPGGYRIFMFQRLLTPGPID